MCPILGPLVPLFWISGDVSSGLQSQSQSVLLSLFIISLFCGGKCNVHSPRSTSGATPANLMTVGIPASHLPTCISKSDSWLRFEWEITHTEDECTTIVPVTRLVCKAKNFFLKYFCQTHSNVLFYCHWYPSFGFLVMSPLGFKARVGSALFALQRQM